MLMYFALLMYFAMAPMDPCDERNMDQVQNYSKFIMKTAVNYSSILYIMEARSIPTYDSDEYGNNVSFMVRMDDDGDAVHPPMRMKLMHPYHWMRRRRTHPSNHRLKR